MRERLRLLMLPLFVLVGLMVYAKAFADAGDPPAPSQAQNLAMMWPAFGLLAATIGAYLTRKLSAEYTFFHSGGGAVLLGALGAVISSVTPILQSSTVTWVALVWAAIGGATSFFAALNPSSTKDDPPAKSPLARPGAALVLPILIGFGLMLTGCPKPLPNPNGPTPTQQYEEAFGQCMKQKGIAVAVNDGAAVWSILDNPTASQADKIKALESLGVTTASGALTDLATCALYSWDMVHTISPGATPTTGQSAKRVFASRHGAGVGTVLPKADH